MIHCIVHCLFILKKIPSVRTHVYNGGAAQIHMYGHKTV